MANVIHITSNFEEGITETFPLLEDVQITLNNTYQPIGDLVAGISELVGLITTASTLLTGGMPQELAKANNILSFPRWTNTDPIKINTKLLFYTKTDSYKDVVYPMNFFIRLATISLDKDNRIAVPGVALGEVLKDSTPKTETIQKKPVKSLNKKANAEAETNTETEDRKKSFSSKSKLVSIYIPGIVYINKAFIETIAPTYSRQKTKSGYPLWGMIDIQFSGALPAMAENFTNVSAEPESFTQGLLR